MNKYLAALAALAVGTALTLPAAVQAAGEQSTAAKTPAKKTVHTKKAAPKPAASKEDLDDPEPDVAGSVAVDYSCELGSKLTIHANLADPDHIALRWQHRLIRLERVGTTTGANRFESRKRGLIWIGIPAKGILLDSRRGQQLANECKNAEQLAMKNTPAPAGDSLIARGADAAKTATPEAVAVAAKK